MDGSREDAEVLFILTANRPDQIEPALASRPGQPLERDANRTGSDGADASNALPYRTALRQGNQPQQTYAFLRRQRRDQRKNVVGR
jgi:hypothetical protein